MTQPVNDGVAVARTGPAGGLQEILRVERGDPDAAWQPGYAEYHIYYRYREERQGGN